MRDIGILWSEQKKDRLTGLISSFETDEIKKSSLLVELGKCSSNDRMLNFLETNNRVPHGYGFVFRLIPFISINRLCDRLHNYIVNIAKCHYPRLAVRSANVEKTLNGLASSLAVVEQSADKKDLANLILTGLNEHA